MSRAGHPVPGGDGRQQARPTGLPEMDEVKSALALFKQRYLENPSGPSISRQFSEWMSRRKEQATDSSRNESNVLTESGANEMRPVQLSAANSSKMDEVKSALALFKQRYLENPSGPSISRQFSEWMSRRKEQAIKTNRDASNLPTASPRLDERGIASELGRVNARLATIEAQVGALTRQVEQRNEQTDAQYEELLQEVRASRDEALDGKEEAQAQFDALTRQGEQQDLQIRTLRGELIALTRQLEQRDEQLLQEIRASRDEALDGREAALAQFIAQTHQLEERDARTNAQLEELLAIMRHVEQALRPQPPTAA